MLGRLQDLSAAARRALMLHALLRLPQLLGEDRVVLEHLRVAPFVDTGAGSLQAPSSLYNPRCPAFAGMRQVSTALDRLQISHHVQSRKRCC